MIEMARTCLIAAGMPPAFFGECLSAAVYITNRVPSIAEPDSVPLSKWYGKTEPHHSLELRAFGAHAWVTVSDPKSMGKALPRSIPGILCGYCSKSRAYRIYCRSLKKVLVSDSVAFDENSIGPVARRFRDLSLHDLFDSDTPADRSELSGDDASGDGNDLDQEHVLPEPPTSSRPRRSYAPTDRALESFALSSEAKRAETVPTQRTFVDGDLMVPYALLSQTCVITEEEALRSPQWSAAIDKESKSLEGNGTFSRVTSVPPGRTIVRSRWVFAKKQSTNGETVFKARLVAMGFSQKPGVDFTTTWAPTARAESIRLVIALAAAEGSELHSLDFSSAYLNATLDVPIYLRTPAGANICGTSGGSVLKVERALYGMRQSAARWFGFLTEELRKLGFAPTRSDPCVFVGSGESYGMIIALHVDDLLIMFDRKEGMDYLLRGLKKSKLSLKHTETVMDFVGLQFCRKTKGFLKIHQADYTKSILERFGYQNAHKVPTPAYVSYPSKDSSQKSTLSKYKMSSIVGALLYLSLQTRPDIAYAVSHLAQFSANPQPEHYLCAARILRYLNGTRDQGILFPIGQRQEPLAYVDANFVDKPAVDESDARSRSGHTISLGGPICWRSQKQKLTATSTAVAELYAAYTACCEVVWLRNILCELGFAEILHGPTLVYEDNLSVIDLSKTHVHKKSARWVKTKFGLLNDWFKERLITLTPIHTASNVADALTKPLPREAFTRLTSVLVR